MANTEAKDSDEPRWSGLADDDLTWGRRTRDFVERSVTPYVESHRDEEWTARPADRVPWQLIDEADGLGLRTLTLPRDFGGSEVTSTLTLAVVAEELARGESALVDILLQGWKISAIVNGAAAPSRRQHWLERFANEPRLLCSHCSTEPQGSSDRWLGVDTPEAAMRTRAERSDDGWVLDGGKQFITNGSDAELYIVYATTQPGAPPSQGTSSFLVPRGTPGFTVGRVFEKLGGRLFNNAELAFENCRLPADHLLIEKTAAGSSARFFPHSKVVIAAQAVGVAQAAFERAVQFSQTRVQGGKPIVQHQLVAARLADMATDIEVTRAFVRHAARMVEARAPSRRSLAYMAKLHAGEMVFRVARSAVELHGGLGVMRHAGIDRYLRDATLFLHLDGTNDIHRLKVATELFGQSPATYAGGSGAV